MLSSVEDARERMVSADLLSRFHNCGILNISARQKLSHLLWICLLIIQVGLAVFFSSTAK